MAEREVEPAEALGALYANYRVSLTNTAQQALLAHGIPESVISAEDLVQNAFAKVLRHPASVEYPVSYLRVVIRTEAANRARQQARHNGLEAVRPIRCASTPCSPRMWPRWWPTAVPSSRPWRL
ncbi:sigma factor [Streptomyces sp. M3]|uniref:sigma factor n=1 Tax=Streptomyces sp. M3 TaxID=295102 RepID=UPI00100EC368|nr:sigma factor [Streptomyces sp. M3]